MILSEMDLKEALYRLVSNSVLRKKISGNVYRDYRPLNSKVEDVVISVLASGAGQIQVFEVNINLYVPDVKRGKEFIEDTDRITVLMRACLDLLERGVMNIKVDNRNVEFGTLFVLDSQKLYKVNGDDFHVISNRLTVKISTE